MELCHSITGGSLAAQGEFNFLLKSINVDLRRAVGYWMPFEAAKAIATTFCWKIRFALVPIFGVEFLSQCTPPSSTAYKLYLIDSAITRRCAAEQKGRASGKGPVVNNSNRSHKALKALPPSLSEFSQHPLKGRSLRPREIKIARITDECESDDSSLTGHSWPLEPDENGNTTAESIEPRRNIPPRIPIKAPTKPNPISATPKRKRNVEEYTEDEMRAARQLVAMKHGVVEVMQYDSKI